MCERERERERRENPNTYSHTSNPPSPHLPLLELKVAGRLREEVTEFKQTLAIVIALASKALDRRHWEMLSDVVASKTEAEGVEKVRGGRGGGEGEQEVCVCGGGVCVWVLRVCGGCVWGG